MPLLVPEAAISHPWAVASVVVADNVTAARTAVAGDRTVPDLDSYAGLFSSTSQKPKASAAQQVVTRWAMLGGSGVSHVESDIFRNTTESIVDYFLFDDGPTPLAGEYAITAQHGPLGYWRTSLAGDDQLYAVSGLKVMDLVTSLAGMSDGWIGPDSVAPSPAVCADVYAALTSMWQVSREPEVEVDDDGSVALLWEESGRSFALTFMGNGKVVGTLSPRTADYAPWTVAVTEHEALYEKVTRPQVAPLLA